ncbi:unnamed protein product [Schistosoma margrebowiei]|uniref:Uncharacterized protein n=1 Tax=Schistosoma margrebowiei TaxID=48269 RepID=A0A183N9G9_9TREM|nr:unnamed protein product [Schistosoma margrebowiei]
MPFTKNSCHAIAIIVQNDCVSDVKRRTNLSDGTPPLKLRENSDESDESDLEKVEIFQTILSKTTLRVLL